jgi:hypothetical protein
MFESDTSEASGFGMLRFATRKEWRVAAVDAMRKPWLKCPAGIVAYTESLHAGPTAAPGQGTSLDALPGRRGSGRCLSVR